MVHMRSHAKLISQWAFKFMTQYTMYYYTEILLTRFSHIILITIFDVEVVDFKCTAQSIQTVMSTRKKSNQFVFNTIT